MKEESHITPDEMAAYAAGEMDAEAMQRAANHVADCPDCSERLRQMKETGLRDLTQFVGQLNDTWNRDRLRAMGVSHPSTAELEAVWLNDAAQFDLDAVKSHAESCDSCRAHLRRLEEGYSALMELDPLNQPAWSDMVRKRFAVGIEMVVEAASGAYTSAAGMMRDVMTPQARVQLAPAPALAMGGASRGESSIVWSDATFTTDELSGEITGSTDPNTGRGIITVVINKTGSYVASPPIVDLVNEKGTPVATQFSLDMGDRYSAHFEDLDQGRYLIGIREPGE